MFIDDINMLSQSETDMQLCRFNDFKYEYNNKTTICGMFESTARRNGAGKAVTCSDGTLTYSELDALSDAVANRLFYESVKKEDVVGVVTSRETDVVAGILGIFKAGCAYMPIDPKYPENRVGYMVGQSKAKIILAHKKLDFKLKGTKVIILNEIEKTGGNFTLKATKTDPSDLAYVLYTSGSTGKPKGVMIEHRNVINLVYALYDRIYKNYTGCLNIAVMAPFSFDASVKQLFCALLLGHHLFVVPDDVHLDGIKMAEYYKANNIDISDGTPMYIAALTNIPEFKKISVKNFLIGGEAVSNSLIKRFKRVFKQKNTVITNVYGPTECCVDSTLYLIDPQTYREADNVPIGKPINNGYIYILNKQNQLLPIGAVGEICISGAGVGRGYLNDENLTKEKFVDDIFRSGQRMYHTGDLGKWTYDGNVKFMGRMDRQVKIRGYRIELDEIKNVILGYKGVKDAAVVVENNAIKAYITTDESGTFEGLKDYLTDYLPPYMIPSYIKTLEAIPLTENGKVDVKSLSDIGNAEENKVAYQEPETEIERALCRSWEKAFEITKVGINDNFFSLGGDSIKAIQVVSELEQCGYRASVLDIIKYQTIKKIGKHIKTADNKVCNEPVTGGVELVPLQYWLFEQCKDVIAHRNLSFMLYRRENFGEYNVRKIFDEIFAHHDALRMVFTKTGGVIRQYNEGVGQVNLDLKVIDLRGNDNYAKVAEIEANKLQDSFNLEKGPLVKLCLFKADNGEHLLIIIHQLIIDHISWRVILNDFAAAYRQLLNGQEIRLMNKTSSFKQWADSLHKYADSDELIAEKAYWNKVDSVNVCALPTDYESDNNIVRYNNLSGKEFSLEETNRILKQLNKSAVKVDELLISAWGITLNEQFGFNSFALNLGGHGRESNISDKVDISRTVGRFSSIYPVAVDIPESGEAEEKAGSIITVLREIPHNGVGYGILKYVTDSSNKKDMKFRLNPEVSFNYMGQFDRDFDNDIFTISELPCGKNLSDNENWRYKLKILSLIKNGVLDVGLEYNTKQYGRKTIDALLHKYVRNILLIVHLHADEQLSSPEFWAG